MLTWLRKLFGGREGAREGSLPEPPVSASPDALAEMEALIERLVAGGFEGPAEILQAAEDYVADELDQDRIHVESGPMLERALAAHAAAEASWPVLTDCDKLDAAFAALERQGVVARQNFSCCGNCGSSEIWDEIDAMRDAGEPVSGYAFFHMQDTERATEGGGLYLNYGAVDDGETAALAVAHRIVGELEAKGLQTYWDGSWDARIGVSLDWKRRRARLGDQPAVPPSATLH